MPKVGGDPLTKATLNLFTEDVEWFKERYGQGYSEHIRQALHTHIRRIVQVEIEYKRHQYGQ